jgi:hypothetical protein
MVLRSRRFSQGGIAWTDVAASAFDFQTIEAAQQFWRENGLVRVRIVWTAAAERKSLSGLRRDQTAVKARILPTCGDMSDFPHIPHRKRSVFLAETTK